MRTPAAMLAASVAAAAVVLASPSVVAAGPTPPDPVVARRPAVDRGADPATVIPGHYLVVLHPGRRADLRRLAARANDGGGTVTRRYGAALHGFAARLSSRSAEALRHDPAVAFVEPDRRVSAATTQSSPPWGLDRIDQRSLPLNKRYVHDNGGTGVTAYVLDSGIRKTHQQFGGRVLSGFTAIKDGRGTGDCNGHGTHVAGTIGGKTYGVAKKVTLRPVRVLNCRGNGSISGIVAGIDWVTSHHTGKKPAVANLSLGGDWSPTMNTALRKSVFDGVTYVVAAGNESMDACNLSPAGVGSAITVGATGPRDGRPSFSDYGPCVDVFAPGVGIRSASNKNNTASVMHDGTSMASPHVAGAAALYLQAHPSAAPAQVNDAIVAAATTGKVTGRGPGSPDRLLYSRVDRVAPGPVLPPAGNVVVNPSFEAGRKAPWSASDGVITDDTFGLARTGSWAAWLLGYGVARSDSLSQTVTVPPGASPKLSFWMLVASDEDPVEAFDTLTLRVVSGGVPTDLHTWSNLDATGTYQKHTFDLTPFAGQTVTLRFAGVEDSGTRTNFIIDDVYVTAG